MKDKFIKKGILFGGKCIFAKALEGKLKYKIVAYLDTKNKKNGNNSHVLATIFSWECSQ